MGLIKFMYSQVQETWGVPVEEHILQTLYHDLRRKRKKYRVFYSRSIDTFKTTSFQGKDSSIYLLEKHKKSFIAENHSAIFVCLQKLFILFQTYLLFRPI